MLLRKHCLLATAVVIIGTATAATAGMIDIGTLDNSSYSTATGISGDGTKVVGGSKNSSGNITAFLYTNGAFTSLGTLGGLTSTANGISGDGTTIVGNSLTSGSDTHAFKYVDSVMTDLGVISGTYSIASAVSADGSVITGRSDINSGVDQHAFRYTTAGGMVDIGTLGTGTYSTALGISGDGSTIVGKSNITSGSGVYHAFKHTTADGMVDLGTMGGTDSRALSASYDGAIIVGESDLASGDTHPFKYTAGGGMVDLGTLGGDYASASAISSDGTVIVGYSTLTPAKTIGTAHAFKYANGTMSDLGTLGGTYSVATGVSSNGGVITGYSTIDTTGATYHSFMYRSSMVDMDNTVAAIANNGSQLNSELNLKATLLAEAVDADCDHYSDRGICLAVSGWRYSGNESAKAAQTASTLKASYRFNKAFRAGVLVDLAFSSTNPDNFDAKKSPLVGAFAVLGNNETGTGAQLKLSAAANRSDATITRTALTNTEAGKGDSKFKSVAAKAELGYGMEAGGWKALPYVGLRWSNVSRDGYVESAGATFPVSYNEIAQKQLTALFGLRAEKKLFSAFGLAAGAGVEQDLNSRMGAYNGTVDTLGAFNLVAPNVTNTRPFGNVTAFVDMGAHNRLSAGVSAKREALGTTYGTILSGQYSVAF